MKPKLSSRHLVVFLSLLLAISMLTPLQESHASSPTDLVAITAGPYHNLAVKGDGTVWAWGDNYYGEIGDGTLTNRSVPVQVQGLDGVTAVAAGFGHKRRGESGRHRLDLGWELQGTVGRWHEDQSVDPDTGPGPDRGGERQGRGGS
jgi:alpha-tubulin suppressor-like RCC1 family protein